MKARRGRKAQRDRMREFERFVRAARASCRKGENYIVMSEADYL